MRWKHKKGEWDLTQQPLVMGILNVTPDSFSDGNQFLDPQCAIDQAHSLIEQGADILDIGAESSRPGAQSVNAQEEWRRLQPVLKKITSQISVPVSIDTTKSEIARLALQEGASIINDVSGGKDNVMLSLIAEQKCGYVLMHTQGDPQTMQIAPHYQNVIHDISLFFNKQLKKLNASGIHSDYIAIDPGIGFGKTWQHNREILLNLNRFTPFHRPLLIGLSRKSFLGKITDTPPTNRLGATLAMETLALWQGACIIRTHDVASTKQMAKMITALKFSSYDLA